MGAQLIRKWKTVSQRRRSLHKGSPLLSMAVLNSPTRPQGRTQGHLQYRPPSSASPPHHLLSSRSHGLICASGSPDLPCSCFLQNADVTMLCIDSLTWNHFYGARLVYLMMLLESWCEGKLQGHTPSDHLYPLFASGTTWDVWVPNLWYFFSLRWCESNSPRQHRGSA